ncbi:MAG TPA: phosphoribosylaminoimidazolesuccinocarboxamide synthase [Candidatus Nanoarchaeia archaeon]|nr:phosphoribosylaminoimidazolesuccinocarboxamide synthase [Candidatus Nanoarchaeia archaeon]
MGSVKNLIYDPSMSGGVYYAAPTPDHFGLGAWKVSGRFSVADLKGLIPPVEIENKGAIMAMMTAAYFEQARKEGFPTTYVGLLSPDERIVDVDMLMQRGDISDTVIMLLANAPANSTSKELAEYHAAVNNDETCVYVADTESIFRAGFPLGSSSFKKIFEMAGRGHEYEHVATYDETVQVLDDIRHQIDLRGWTQFQHLRDYLDSLSLWHVPNPGETITSPVLNFTTKFALSGDEDISEAEAERRMGVDHDTYLQWKNLVEQCAKNQIEFCKERGIVNIDGKIEGVVAHEKLYIADFACTPDENRLMIPYEYAESGKPHATYLIPTNKEMQRAMFRAEGVYLAIDAAKEEATRKGNKDQWRDYLFNHISRQKLDDVAEASCDMMGDALRTVANLVLGRKVFEARPMEEWIGPFLPYASRVQPKI